MSPDRNYKAPAVDSGARRPGGRGRVRRGRCRRARAAGSAVGVVCARRVPRTRGRRGGRGRPRRADRSGREGRRVPRARAADQGRLRELPQARDARRRGGAGSGSRPACARTAAGRRQPRPRARGAQTPPAPTPVRDAENGGSPLVSGIRLVHADVIAALARVGIEPFSPKGEPFDPQHHEAIAQQPVDGAASGTVVEVYQRGYRLGRERAASGAGRRRPVKAVRRDG